MIFDDEENKDEEINQISEYNPNEFSEFENPYDVVNVEEINIPIEETEEDEIDISKCFQQITSDHSFESKKLSNDKNNDYDDINKEKNEEDSFFPSAFVDTEENTQKNKAEENSFSPPTFVDTEENTQANNAEDISSYETKNESPEDEKLRTENFYEKKISYNAANKNTQQPKQINKRFLMTVIISVFLIVFLVVFLMPTKSQKPGRESESKVASKTSLADFESIAKRQSDYSSSTTTGEEVSNYSDYSNYSNTSSETENNYVPKRETQYDENGNVIIPPVITSSPSESKQTYSQSTSTTTIEIPNTRNDGLHSKSISGIKGLTGTQQNYSNSTTSSSTTGSSTQRINNYTLPDKEEYMNSMLDAYSSVYGGQSDYVSQNDQSGKNSFYNNGRNAEGTGQGTWLPLNSIWQGTIFEAVISANINTDLPGDITARVAKNVYSSQDGRYLLIPQNSILYGSYNSSISYSQNRVQVVWHTLIRPDGYQLNLGSMNTTDAQGASGLQGKVNDHPFAYLKAIGLMSVFSILGSEVEAANKEITIGALQELLTNTQEVTADLGDKLLDRALNIQPTIKIKHGTKINIVANQTLTLPPCEEIPVVQQYKKY